jgi:hypothetical protein
MAVPQAALRALARLHSRKERNMKKHLPDMAGATALGKSWRPRATAIALGLATAALGAVSADAIQLAPGFGTTLDSNVIQVQKNDRDGDRHIKKFGNRVDSENRNVRRENSSSHRSVERENSSFQRKVDRAPDVRVQYRIVRQGWSRDRRHAFYGAYLLGVPMGYAAYASHPCYAWLVGPQGPGYYWNYDRCPV